MDKPTPEEVINFSAVNLPPKKFNKNSKADNGLPLSSYFMNALKEYTKKLVKLGPITHVPIYKKELYYPPAPDLNIVKDYPITGEAFSQKQAEMYKTTDCVEYFRAIKALNVE